jgi:hypothetical protein
VVSNLSNHQVGEPPLVAFQQIFNQHIRSYRSRLEASSPSTDWGNALQTPMEEHEPGVQVFEEKWWEDLDLMKSKYQENGEHYIMRGFMIYSVHHIVFCLCLYSPCGRRLLLQFLSAYTVGRTPWTGDQPVARPLPTHRTTQTQNKCTHTSMSRVGFEPRFPVFERLKTVHALDRAATVIGAAWC